MEHRFEILEDVYVNPQIVLTKRGAIEYDIAGKDGPVILGVHGGIGGVDQARIILNWVNSKEYRLLSLSRPGYLGTPLDSGKTIEEQADLFVELLDILGIDKVAVVSVSAGGPPGYMFAIRHPERVWALIAIDCISGFYEKPETAGPIMQAIFMSQIGQRLLKMVGDANPGLFLNQLFAAEAYFTKSQVREHVEYAMKYPELVKFVKAFMNSMNPYDARKPGTDNDMEQFRKLTHLPLEKIQCPSLIIHGTHDADVKFYDGVYAFEHIPVAERYWIEEGSHLGFWLNSHAHTAQAVARKFLKKHSPRTNTNSHNLTATTNAYE